MKIVRWLNYAGDDGLNCRILNLLPIHRGGDKTEFFFKSASTTTKGISRKTVFALKFEKLEDANEFEMWWLSLSGQIDKWNKNTEISTNVASKASNQNKDAVDESKIDYFFNNTNRRLKEIVNVSNEVKFLSPNSKSNSKKGKRKFKEMRLKSPTAYSTSASFCFDKICSPGMKSPLKKKAKIKTDSSDDDASSDNNASLGDNASSDDNTSSDDEEDNNYKTSTVIVDNGQAAMSQGGLFFM